MTVRVRHHHEEPITEANRALLEVATAFATAFPRWIASGSGDGLTYPRIRVLEQLHCQGPTKLKALADLVGMSARNLTVLADGLETEGLARRVDHPTDRRITLLDLTPDGRAAAEETLAPRLARIGQIFDHLSSTERDDLEHALRLVVAEIDLLTAAAGCTTAAPIDCTG